MCRALIVAPAATHPSAFADTETERGERRQRKESATSEKSEESARGREGERESERAISRCN